MDQKKHWVTRVPVAVNVLAITVAEIALVALMFLTIYAVLARYVFRSPSMYAMEISTYLLLVVAWCSVGWAHHVNKHVSVEAFSMMLSRKWQRYADIVSQLTILVFCSVIFWSGTKVVITALERNYRSASLLKFPLWVAYLTIPIGALALVLIVLVRLRQGPPALQDSDKAS